MKAIKSKGMKPELMVRQLAHKLGYRYRLHRHDLPGRPDLVFPSRRKIIQVHGCFWHQHPGCRHARIPATRRDYWVPKLARTVERDAASEAALAEAGWSVLILWECELRDPDLVEARLTGFLGPPGKAR